MGGGSGQRGATIGQLQAATDGNCDRMRQILRDPSLARRKREGYINAMRNLGCDTAVMTTVAMGAAGGAFGGLGHGLAITANTWTFGLISPLDSHAEGLQDAYGHLAEYRIAAGAAEIGREAAIAALTGGAGNVALKAGRGKQAGAGGRIVVTAVSRDATFAVG